MGTKEIAIQDSQRVASLSLPQCVTLRLKWMGMVEGKRYLSHGLDPLTQTEIDNINFHIKLIEARLEPGDEREKLTMVAAMLVTFPGERMDETTVRARNHAYNMAVFDMPVWAVREAIRKWIRGKVSGIPLTEFKWAPWPAVLRKIAEDEVRPYQEALDNMRWVLEAKPLQDTLADLDTRGCA